MLKAVKITTHVLKHLLEEGQRHNFKVMTGVPQSLEMISVDYRESDNEVVFLFSDGVDHGTDEKMQAYQDAPLVILNHDLDVAPDVPEKFKEEVQKQNGK